jgi:hypothetical protein
MKTNAVSAGAKKLRVCARGKPADRLQREWAGLMAILRDFKRHQGHRARFRETSPSSALRAIGRRFARSAIARRRAWSGTSRRARSGKAR